MSWYWAKRGDPVKLLSAIEKDKAIDVNAQHVSGRRPLHYAAILGHPKCIRALIKRGAVIDPVVQPFLIFLNLNLNFISSIIKYKIYIKKITNFT